MNPRNEISRNASMKPLLYHKKTPMVTNADPRRRKNMTGEAKRVKMDGGFE